MQEKYRSLVRDTKQFLQENFVHQQVLLSSYRFPPFKTPPFQPDQQEPLPPTPSPFPPQKVDRPYPKIEKKKEAFLPTASSFPEPLPPVQPPLQPDEQEPLSPPPSPCPRPNVKISAYSKNNFKDLLKTFAPHVKVLDELPSDIEAKKIAEAWKEEQFIEEVTIFSFAEGEKEYSFLQNLCKAIDIRLKPARILDGRRIEKEDKWKIVLQHPKIRFILSSPISGTCPKLLEHYKELPATNELKIGNIPLILLQPISSYLQNPLLKVSLWQRLSTQL